MFTELEMPMEACICTCGHTQITCGFSVRNSVSRGHSFRLLTSAVNNDGSTDHYLMIEDINT